MDPYETIAPYYDCEQATFHEDIDFYLRLIHAGPILEVGAGTGRIMQPLAVAGFEIWGIDSSAPMLELARERLAGLPSAHLVRSSILDLALNRRFAAAIFPLNTLWHLATLDDQLAALRMVRNYLEPSALLIVDLSNPLSLADRAGNGEIRQRFRGDCGGAILTVRSASEDDEARQLLNISLTYDEQSADGHLRQSYAELKLRYTYRSELELLLRLAGFDVQQIYGSYDLEPYSAEGPGLIAVSVPAVHTGSRVSR